MLSNKQSVEEVLIEKAVKTTIQILYDKGLIDTYGNAKEVLKGYLLFEVDENSRPGLDRNK